ncbi:uncharacterized protein EI90DRAFT_3023412 [Cantharellus anzutake]|uniref:uncharacterized protein n=1 Tax=Cantharellus anzutake TaxID=1750568 RepID=UPI00190794E2|nr:uncharacterized protein EI90DRAFT_3023412 [Cantharellus anzutake]KAF8311783.1 hypothetical protein EI90DRAFT_3023412 [Cantharellus anzutake]
MLEVRQDIGANPGSPNVPTRDRGSGMGVAKVRCAAIRLELRQSGGKVTWRVGRHGVGDGEVVRKASEEKFSEALAATVESNRDAHNVLVSTLLSGNHTSASNEELDEAMATIHSYLEKAAGITVLLEEPCAMRVLQRS